MKIIGINGSPRKEWNTAELIKKALEGAISEGAETELIHLYEFSSTKDVKVDSLAKQREANLTAGAT